MELIEKISSYLNWLDNDGRQCEMPDWMGGDEWVDCEDGSAETWEFVLLRDAKEELQQATEERDALIAIMKRFIAPQDYPEWQRLPEHLRKQIEGGE